MEQTMEQLGESLEEIIEALHGEALEPDPGRRDWDEQRDTVAELETRFRESVLGDLAELGDGLDDEERDGVNQTVAAVGARLAVLLLASGRWREGTDLIAEMAALAEAGSSSASSSGLAAKLRAGERDPDNYLAYMHGRFLVMNQEPERAREAFDRVIENSEEKVLISAARDARVQARPLTSAPTLFRWNGFGVGLYGDRDAQDGTYVTTHCVSALWIPVLPLAAYRVVREGDGYYFLSRAPLSQFAIWYRRVALVAAALAIVVFAVSNHLRSPDRLARKAFDDARQAEQAGDVEAAIAGYESLLDEYGHELHGPVIRDTGVALAGLYLSRVAAPADRRSASASVDHIIRVLRRVDQMPRVARDAAVAGVVIERVQAWSEAMGHDSTAAAQARLFLLDTAIALTNGGAVAAPLVAERTRARMGLAASLEPEWPLEALAQYMDEAVQDEDAFRAAGRVVEALGDRHSLLRSAAPDIENWLAGAGNRDDLASRGRAVMERMTAAQAVLEDPERKQLLGSAGSPDSPASDDATGARKPADTEALAVYLERSPHDQEIAIALAEARASAGDIPGALSVLTGFGGPGWLIPEGQQLLATLYMEAGMLAEADEVLGRIVGFRLPRMQRARLAYTSKARSVEDGLIAQARTGRLPSDLEQRLVGLGEAEQQKIFGEWLGEKLESHPELTRLRDAYTTHSSVVPLSLTLGTVKLRRANSAAGDERQALLDEAEQAFLAIRQDAEGVPSYHLGLAQVYHRLGRTEDGEAEFRHVLGLEQPELTLQVVNAYRDLGLPTRAKEVAETVWQAGQAPYHQMAANILGIMASDPDEAETWFRRADQSAPDVRMSLRRLEAQRFAREGDMKAADRAMAEVAAFHARDARHSAASANNAAVAYLARFQYTGDRKHVIAACDNFDHGLRLEPDRAVTVRNAIRCYEILGLVQVLEPWLDILVVTRGIGDSFRILALLAGTSLRPRVTAAVKKNPAFRRMFTLLDRYVVLAPRSPFGYQTLVAWYDLLDDEARLVTVRDAVARQGDFDTTEADALRASYVAGEDDEKLLQDLDGEFANARALLDKAPARGPARAAGEALIGRLMENRGDLTSDRADLEQAVAAYRRARTAWPQLGVEQWLATALVQVAIIKAAGQSPELAAQWDRGRRVHGAALVLHQAMAGEHGATITAALRKQPELAEAARLARESAVHLPGLSDWVLGRIAGDGELEAAGAAWFQRPSKRLSIEIAALLEPGNASSVATLEIMKAGAGN